MTRDDVLRRMVAELQLMGFGGPKRVPVDFGVLVLSESTRVGGVWDDDHEVPNPLDRPVGVVQAFAMMLVNAIGVVDGSQRTVRVWLSIPNCDAATMHSDEIKLTLNAMARATATKNVYAMGWELLAGDTFARYEEIKG